MTASESPTVTLSPLRRRHLDAVVAIEEASHPSPWSRGLFEIELGRPDRHYVIARDGDRIVGFAGLIVIVDDAHVATVTVDPAHRGRRIAVRLLLELIDAARAREIEQMTLEVRVSNEPALALYRRFGFAPAGIRPGYYDDGEDAFVMWLHDLLEPDVGERIEAIRAALPSPTERFGFVDPGAGTVPRGRRPR